MKEFQALRTSLQEGTEDLTESPTLMPPNILILRRQTVRQYPGGLMVALYYNDKLKQYFSIPYGAPGVDSTITPTSIKEEAIQEEPLNEISIPVATRAFHARQELGDKAKNKKQYRAAIYHYAKATKNLDRRAEKYKREDKGETVREEVIQEDAISHLQRVRAFKTSTALNHKDGSQTKVDPQTANALLTVHAAMHPDNKKKFADALEHSQPKFHKMLDFAWKQVK